jgi:hypothetical protein
MAALGRANSELTSFTNWLRRTGRLGKTLLSVGLGISVVALARINLSLRRAFSANPHEVSSALTRLGYSSPPSEAEILIVGYQYALLRKPFPELDGTTVQLRQRALSLWFVFLFAGVLIGLAGLVIEAVEINAARI